ncbi:hypothetical protein I6G82_11960 [Lysinibacillus macroides]|uniref:Uncharacterized protein n=1 Tax=Lysinibacillus macroides TaxID=33935 RepID=A0A0M9DKU1_9BACI|nr:hypothetical protein [Lysinibacillus macroides]KOY82929.1 hypothetical protein ADM90_06305 [Lysinibacillus macroides]QPR70221.1 hypothetical protein I6G82_11960 [Lysinibacillus macroides]
MSVSLYYTCVRNKPLTNEENKKITAIITTYNNNFQWSDIGETFYVYDADTTTTIFQGATKLPLVDDYEATVQTLFYWLQCLTEIRQVIVDGDWHVHLDDVEAIWAKENGWQMPN